MNRKILMLVCCLFAILLLGIFPMTAQDIPGIIIADLLATAATSPERAFTLFSAMILDADPSVLAALDNPNNRLTVFVPTVRAIEQLRSSRFGAAAYFVFGLDREMVTQTLLYHDRPWRV